MKCRSIKASQTYYSDYEPNSHHSSEMPHKLQLFGTTPLGVGPIISAMHG